MSISRQEVEKVALLARLTLSDDEAQLMTRQLNDIVSYVDELSQVDTDGVEPMAHAIEVHNVLRPDEVRDSLPRQSALANAPKHSGAGYLVPAVLGD
ncbi:Glutamyl-tRNA(Gln) amidotransferase subunit C [Posidoniimonas polymericola]|uniref:Aspartyl/glutamyl-tRNA(Asn/Gln) amidotransferase subunit C n=1 Tax=Posidoniimonas polymericola TaxID=2528002 RepID=A0A5C5YMG7_9BACT|nr:Asp-tRNA(Asn)/Glu-tRNA(Gln) amidotransferase subunit GatC [Posidoniimonas polymericola]TWT76020.1 Glutamyl-tRNA(Gln) amidotransferase subunit C [Posidoniimonas polymericola]